MNYLTQDVTRYLVLCSYITLFCIKRYNTAVLSCWEIIDLYGKKKTMNYFELGDKLLDM